MKDDDTHMQTLQRGPDEWKAGDEPLTEAQRTYLETLAREAGEAIEPGELTKAEASRRIEELRKKSARPSTEEPEDV